ncbi:MAG: cobalamin-dependent protein [Planctomycetales bacterium]|nr:cobalamin-dependent protein [Planctomycetales bacterium]
MITATRSEPLTETSALETAALKCVREVYHQINFVRDLEAVSRAIDDALRPITANDLDDTFAQVNDELLQVASHVATSCEDTHRHCKNTQEILTAATAAYDEIRSMASKLVEHCEKVNQVTQTVEGFARQTSLLSLNARIEAARAGQAGAGFAVVAEEISKLADCIRGEADAIRHVVGDVSGGIADIHERIERETDRNHEQESSVREMLVNNEKLVNHSRNLPATVQRLDQFLEPLERAREAADHNDMQHVTIANLDRNLSSIHRALRDGARKADSAAIDTISLERFTDHLAKSLTEGEEAPVVVMLQKLLDEGHTPEHCLDAVGKAVQSANMRQKHRHISVGDYYLNFMVVEQALEFLDAQIGAPESSGMKVVLGNARGDYHSLGREMVGLFLRAAGIEVIDVGLGAEPEKFVAAVRASNARVVGVSSLLVESAKQITKIRELLDRSGFSSTKIVAGGACFVIDRDFAAEVGADHVATAASDMVSLVEQIYEHDALSEPVNSSRRTNSRTQGLRR